jgi:LysR family transcriptional activator of glutamate synthase operon
MDTEVLRWFQLVADGATVTEVADLHHVSQPGVSRALARLEDEVGVPLLHRSGRVLRPTYAGSVFKRHVDATMHRLDDGLAAVNQLADPATGIVSVAFQLSFGTWLVPSLIAEFRRRSPLVGFELHESDDALGSMVVGGRIDVEFTCRRVDDPSVHWERLFTQPLCLAVPADHRLAGEAALALEQVTDEQFVTLRPSWDLRSRSEELCAAAHFSPRVAFEADDLSVVHGFVAAGLGVAIVPGTGAEPGPGLMGERLVRLTDPDAYREVGLAWSLERRLLPAAEQFRAHTLSTMARRRRQQ